MASAFFPEKMKFLEFACPATAAYNFIRELASFGKVQLVDQHGDDFSQPKRHAESYMACEEAERCLSYIKQNLEKEQDLLPPAPTYAELAPLIAELSFNDTLRAISEADASLREKMTIYQDLCSTYWQKKKKLTCLRFFQETLSDQPMEAPSDRREAGGEIELSVITEVGIASVTGLIDPALLRKLFQTVWRATRRNVVTYAGPANGDVVPYTIVLTSSSVLEKVQKICESFGPDVFVFRADPEELRHMDAELCDEMRQMVDVDRQARDTNRLFMAELASHFWQWRAFVAREKQVWMAMDYGNFVDADDTVIYGGWCPERFVPELAPCLMTAQQDSGSPLPIEMTTVNPKEKATLSNPIPTYIERNSFNSSFQSLNDAYGVPNYDELNGGAFYGMYPFLFGVMFGDIGHAFFYLLAAFAMFGLHASAKKKKSAAIMSESMFAFKWLLFFAAISAIYCGFIYNECFGLPIYMTSSSWTVDVPGKWKRKDGFPVYPFGIDPEWLFKDNELIFLNSYKMKLSVVLGMCQMVFGMFLQLIKHIYRRDVVEIIVTWIPEMMYLVPFFGYLVVIIIVKWLTDWDQRPEQPDAVNLIQMMINMILQFGQEDELLELYSWQWNVQKIIVIIFFVSIPLLLFLKPICECIRLRGTPEFNVLEIFVMNLIHVIEFCLGALSHTASYLRLWALSLAHSQLSHVIYEQVFQMTLKTNNVVLFWIGWAGFAALTAAILLGMEAFSALLHAIRLMWVEFSSKFYEGMGTPFRPLALRKALRPHGIN